MKWAYDCLSWLFVQRALVDFSFYPCWINWIMAFICSPSFIILINWMPSNFYSIVRLWQDRPLFSYSFIICADAFSGALCIASQGPVLDPYMLAPGAQPILYLLFIDDCLLVGWTSIWNAIIFKRFWRSIVWLQVRKWIFSSQLCITA